MKKIILILLIATSSNAVAQKTLYIHRNGVVTNSYKVTEIDSILFHPIGYTRMPMAQVSTLCGTTEGVENGPFATAKFLRPVELAYNSDGNKLYVFDDENTNGLRVIDISTGQVSTSVMLDGNTFGGRITSTMLSKNNDTLFVSRDIWIDVPDATGVFTLTKNGNFSDPIMYSHAPTCNVLAVNPVTGELFGNRFIDAKVLRMNKYPKEDEIMFTVGTSQSDEFRMTWSRDGKTLFTASYYNGAVWKSTYDTNTRQFVGDPEPYVGTYQQKGALEGYRTDARIKTPTNMTTDYDGNLYICDRDNQVIWKADVNGNVKIFAGQVGAAGFNDGEGKYALFNTPEAIAIDHINNIIYVADKGNSKIRKIIVE